MGLTLHGFQILSLVVRFDPRVAPLASGAPPPQGSPAQGDGRQREFVAPHFCAPRGSRKKKT